MIPLSRILVVLMILCTQPDGLTAAEEPAAVTSPVAPTPGARQKIVNGSPEVLADGRVVFRFRSGTAKTVVARGQFGAEVVLVRGEKDGWSGTTEKPVAPGIFEYRLVVDGVALPDPLNREWKPQRWPGTSILHVPATPPAPWDPQAVASGAVHRHSYWSPSLETWRRVVVVTPAGVKAGVAYPDPLPVLYLSHGFSDTEETWTVHGRAQAILDALVAGMKAVPMVLVMPDAHALPPPTGWSDAYASENTDAFARELITEVMPLIESNYPVRKDRAGRAFAGLSMGGRHALTIGLRHADVFSQIGAFSAAVPDAATLEAAVPRADEINAALTRMWIACGRDDFLFQQNESLHATLEKAGLRHEYVVTDGDHSWPVWRRYLADFLPLLFREPGR
jgi:enterochelin esterase-like enzyme